jgi:hypothetical protein
MWPVAFSPFLLQLTTPGFAGDDPSSLSQWSQSTVFIYSPMEDLTDFC